jgi:hypothetical protein
MSLGSSLVAVFLAFLAILAGVMWMAFRERRFGRSGAAATPEGQRASDARVMTVVFAAIPGGMLLTLLVAWLVFL